MCYLLLIIPFSCFFLLVYTSSGVICVTALKVAVLFGSPNSTVFYSWHWYFLQGRVQQVENYSKAFPAYLRQQLKKQLFPLLPSYLIICMPIPGAE